MERPAAARKVFVATAVCHAQRAAEHARCADERDDGTNIARSGSRR